MLVAGYIRVSALGGRDAESESFISVREQRDAIERYCAAKRWDLVWPVQPDLDVSGGKMVRKGLDGILSRIEAKELDGMVVAYPSRFSRTVFGALEVLERVEAAGGMVASADGTLDTSTDVGKMVTNLMLNFAEFELNRIREGWRAAKSRAVGRGVHIGRTPYGYQRDAEGRLTPDPETAPKVREAFEMRVARRPWQEIADHLGVASHSTVRKMIHTPVYLGRITAGARGETFTLEGSHEPLVALDLWERAQDTDEPIRNGTHAEIGLLKSRVFCASCGKKMQVIARSGSPYTSYACRYGKCERPSSIMLPKLDAWVEDQLAEGLRTPGHPAVRVAEEREDYDVAKANLEAARLDLDNWVKATMGMDVAMIRAGIEQRQEAIATARKILAETTNPDEGEHQLVDYDRHIRRLPVQERRDFIRQFVAAVTVAPPVSSKVSPVESRATITWR